MTHGNDTTLTKGGSVAGFADELPEIGAERLQRLAGRQAVSLEPLPCGDVPVRGAGRWWRMSRAAWLDYRDRCGMPARPFSFFVA
jgi:hypothetical protein